MRRRWLLPLIAAGIVAAAANTPAAAEANAERGKTLFQACAACHSLNPKVNKLGPSLNGLIGRPSASVEGFLYSPAMRRAKITWTAELLNVYLESPQSGVFKGNKMPFAGLPAAEDRADLIAYIQEAGK
jgi:cytochrome c